jgi:hypothetical protein
VTRAQAEERLIAEVGAALASHSKRFSRERAIYATIIAVLLLVAFIPRMRNDAAVTVAPSIDTRQGIAASPATDEPSVSTEASNVRASIPSRLVAGESRVREQTPVSPEPNSANRAERPNKLLKTPNAPAVIKKDESKTVKNNASGDKVERTVKVLLLVERGRVLNAVVQNRRAGMESFEALALRIARQRQYPRDFSGRDVLQIDVKP